MLKEILDRNEIIKKETQKKLKQLRRLRKAKFQKTLRARYEGKSERIQKLK